METSTHPLIESDRVEGTSLHDRDGHRVGVVKRMMIEKASGRVAYIVVAFGAYGSLGSDSFMLPWHQVRYDTALGGYRTDLTEGQLAQIPTHARGEQVDLPTPEEEDELHAYFRIPAEVRSV
jgi:hypothetical protein